MSSSNLLRDHLARLFEYDHWANRFVLEAMAGLADLPAKPLDRISHVVVCQQLWLSRMGDKMEPPADIFPHWTLAETNASAEVIFARITEFIAGADDASLRAPFQSRSIEGDRYELTPLDALTQLSLHGSYHRGQIAVELNPLLDEPLTTDFIYQVRKPV